MNKKQVQKRVLQNGRPLALSKFSWDEKTLTFSSDEGDLVIDFKGVDNVNVISGGNSTVKTGDYSTVTTGSYSTVKTGWSSTVKTGSNSTITTGDYSTVTTGGNSTTTTGGNSTVTTGSYSTVKTGWSSTVKTGSYSTVTTGDYSTVTTGDYSTVKTGDYSTVKTGWSSTVTVGEECAIINRNIFEAITPKDGDVIQICPYGIEGHLVNGLYNGKPYIIADGILSKVVNQKGNVFKVINHGEDQESYLIKRGDIYSHGETLQEAKDSLVYKLSDRDTSKYEGKPLSDEVTKEDAIQMYMCITGACSAGVRYFVDQNKDREKPLYSVSDLIELTQGQEGHEQFKNFGWKD